MKPSPVFPDSTMMYEMTESERRAFVMGMYHALGWIENNLDHPKMKDASKPLLKVLEFCGGGYGHHELREACEMLRADNAAIGGEYKDKKSIKRASEWAKVLDDDRRHFDEHGVPMSQPLTAPHKEAE